MANGQWQIADKQGHKRFAQAARTFMESSADEHRFCGADGALDSPSTASPSGKRELFLRGPGTQYFLSVFICVHLWLSRLLHANA
jgi:hypothetical protein